MNTIFRKITEQKFCPQCSFKNVPVILEGEIEASLEKLVKSSFLFGNKKFIDSINQTIIQMIKDA